MKQLIRVAILFLLPMAALASVTSQIDKSGPFVISGLPQTISTGFPFQASADLLVLDSGSTGTPRDPAAVLVLGSDYLVTGGGYNASNQMQVGSVQVIAGGSNLVLSGDTIVIKRGVALNQITSFSATGPLTINLIEQALDKMATLSQQVNEIGGRSLQFEPFEFLTTNQLSLANRKNSILAFDSSGNPTYLPNTTTVGGYVSSIVAGTNVTITSTGAGGTGAVTVNSAGGTPAGSSSALQYNNAGVFGGTYNGTTGLTWNGGNLANTESINGITAAYNFQNTSTGTSAQSYFQIQNSANNFNLGLTGTGFTGTALTGGPTGQQGFISVTGNNPLVFGVNGNMVGEFTSTGLNGAAIGPTTANTGAFTTVTASGTASFGTSSDASPWEVLIHGATKGVRVTTSSTGTDIAGVDNTGSASYQPLTVDGSTLAIANSGTTIATFSSTAGLSLSKTIAGSTGAQTQNTITGEVQFAGAATSLVVTNSLCSSTSIITATICTNDATAVLGSVVKASGSFTINMKTAPTGTTLVDYRITN